MWSRWQKKTSLLSRPPPVWTSAPWAALSLSHSQGTIALNPQIPNLHPVQPCPLPKCSHLCMVRCCDTPGVNMYLHDIMEILLFKAKTKRRSAQNPTKRSFTDSALSYMNVFTSPFLKWLLQFAFYQKGLSNIEENYFDNRLEKCQNNLAARSVFAKGHSVFPRM